MWQPGSIHENAAAVTPEMLRSFRARVTRLDRGQPVQTMFVGKDLDLLPGRYRVELLATRGGDVAPLGLSCEVDVAAGELVAATPR